MNVRHICSKTIVFTFIYSAVRPTEPERCRSRPSHYTLFNYFLREFPNPRLSNSAWSQALLNQTSTDWFAVVEYCLARPYHYNTSWIYMYWVNSQPPNLSSVACRLAAQKQRDCLQSLNAVWPRPYRYKFLILWRTTRSPDWPIGIENKTFYWTDWASTVKRHA
jgi:hypothetical protein